MTKIKKVDFQAGNERKFSLTFLEHPATGVMEVIGSIPACLEL